ncbi:hypothetical protein ACN38_g8934 [Penicillium nordicum]|uniref:Uncharacterized protein n=1 Tax=Penicillium nordicum TaxID=229535 RepID=A0A0M8P2Y0_9EURO|nr:hypothetical protein ACN38_g8934 [Penicillium nordicum]
MGESLLEWLQVNGGDHVIFLCLRHQDPHDDRSIAIDSLSLSFSLSPLCPTQSLRIYQLGFYQYSII